MRMSILGENKPRTTHTEYNHSQTKITFDVNTDLK